MNQPRWIGFENIDFMRTNQSTHYFVAKINIIWVVLMAGIVTDMTSRYSRVFL